MVSAESQAAMDAARKAVVDFMARAGHHNTTVHEKIAPAVTHETITRKTHEEETTVVDREIHADHFHLSIQPITDEEILEEQHTHNTLPVEQRVFEHDDKEEVEQRLNAERAKFRDELVLVNGEKTQTTVPLIAGEHIHHHVHELIQPIINKQTIEPVVIHTVIQIHEIHHNAAQHHATSALPAVSMTEFKRQGGILTGREERYDYFEGEPRSVGGNVGRSHEDVPQSGSGMAQHVPRSPSPEPMMSAPERRGTLSNQRDQGTDNRSAAETSLNQDQTQGQDKGKSGPHSNAPVGYGAPPPSIATAPAVTPTSSSQQQQPTQQQQQPAGHWNLLPLHFAGNGASSGAHPPTGGSPSSLLRPGRSNDQRQGAAARSGGQAGQTGQGQAPPQQRRPSGS